MVTHGTHTLTITFCANIHHSRFIHFKTASFSWPINNYCFCNKTS